MRIILITLAFIVILFSKAYSLTLPEQFEKLLSIVPLDVTSLVATTKQYTVPLLLNKKSTFSDRLKWYCLFQPIFYDNKSSVDISFLEHKEVLWALAAKRNQDIVFETGYRICKLGIHPFECISISRFSSPIEKEFLNRNNKLLEIKKLSNGHVIYSEIGSQVKKYYLFPSSNIFVVVGTISKNESMMEDVATLIQSKPTNELMKSTEDAWGAIDIESSFWGIRKIKTGAKLSKEDIGRTWVTSSFSESKPTVAVFRNVLDNTGVSSLPNPWVKENVPEKKREQVRKDIGMKINMEFSNRLTKMTAECLPGVTATECDGGLFLIFFGEGAGLRLFI